MTDIITASMVRDLLRALSFGDASEISFWVRRMTYVVGGTRDEADQLTERLTHRIGDLPGEAGSGDAALEARNQPAPLKIEPGKIPEGFKGKVGGTE